jgi:hypothetical protein
MAASAIHARAVCASLRFSAPIQLPAALVAAGPVFAHHRRDCPLAAEEIGVASRRIQAKQIEQALIPIKSVFRSTRRANIAPRLDDRDELALQGNWRVRATARRPRR